MMSQAVVAAFACIYFFLYAPTRTDVILMVEERADDIPGVLIVTISVGSSIGILGDVTPMFTPAQNEKLQQGVFGALAQNQELQNLMLGFLREDPQQLSNTVLNQARSIELLQEVTHLMLGKHNEEKEEKLLLVPPGWCLTLAAAMATGASNWSEYIPVEQRPGRAMSPRMPRTRSPAARWRLSRRPTRTTITSSVTRS